MKRKVFNMFAAVNEARGNLMCVNWHAMTVRREAGLLMRDDDAQAGWKTLMKEGWRVRKVRIRVRP